MSSAEEVATAGHGQTGGRAGEGAVAVRLFGGLDGLSGERRAEQSVPLGRAPTVAALCAALGVDVGVIGLVLVNGVHGGLATALSDGDEVSLFPPVGGG